MAVQEGVFFDFSSLFLKCLKLLAKLMVLLDIALCLAPDPLKNLRSLHWIEFLEVCGVQIVPECDLSSPFTGLVLCSSCWLAALKCWIRWARLSLIEVISASIFQLWAILGAWGPGREVAASSFAIGAGATTAAFGLRWLSLSDSLDFYTLLAGWDEIV